VAKKSINEREAITEPGIRYATMADGEEREATLLTLLRND
jgi:hypothetical protein